MPKPRDRQNVKKPRQVVLVKAGNKVPAPGGWVCGSESNAQDYALRDMKTLNYWKAWVEPGSTSVREMWLVLNCGVEPAKNRWGEVSP